ncbi:MAG: lamin tail domain-containing protein [Marinicella sp.]
MKILLTVVAIKILLTIGVTQTHAAVFFSHMIEGSSSNKAIAIYNGNDHVIDLNNYRIERYNNGSITPSDTFDFTSWGFNTLLPGEVFVVANPSANQAILVQADYTHTITFFNGDDALVLVENGVPIDTIGEVGVDPGSGWIVGAGATNNFTLVRRKEVCQGQTNWLIGSTEWDLYPIDTFEGLDYFLPDCQPMNLFISEYVDGPGNNQAVEIFNAGPFAVNLDSLYLLTGGSGVIFGDHVSGYMQAGDLLVVSNPNADDTDLLNATDFSDPALVFDGNDSIHLNINSSTSQIIHGFRNFVDQFGITSNDPGPGGWPVSGGSTNDHTLIRQKQVCSGGSDWGINANQWQTYFNDYYGDLGQHTIRDCANSPPNLVWVWYFDTERGLFVTDGTVADTSVIHDFNIFEVKILNSALPSMLDEQLIEFQPFQGFSWDGSVHTQFYRSNGSLTNGSSFFTLTGPYYGFIAAPDESVLEASPGRGGVLAQGVITVVLDTIFIDGFE